MTSILMPAFCGFCVFFINCGRVLKYPQNPTPAESCTAPETVTRVALIPWLNFVFSSVDLRTRVDPLGLASSHKPFPSGSRGQRQRKSVIQSTRGIPSTNVGWRVEKTACQGIWVALSCWEWSQPTRKQEPKMYNHKEQNSANNMPDLGADFPLESPDKNST